MSFFTDSRIEGLLERETRRVPGPHGETVTIDAFKSLWKAYDFLVLFGFTPERIAEIARDNSERLGISYGESFAAIVWRANRHARDVLGIDCFAIRPIE